MSGANGGGREGIGDLVPRGEARRNLLYGGLVAIALGLLVAYLLRPWFHGLVMFFFKHPLVWLPMVGVAVAAVYIARRAISQQGSATRGRGIVAGVLLVGSLFALIFFSALESALVNRSIYENTTYAEIPGLPAGGTVRIVPREVAVEIASSGFNSPTEALTDFRSVKTPQGNLAWSALRTPDGIVRTFTKKIQGLVTLDAFSTERRVTATDAEFQTAPGLQITDNLRWRLLKEHYLIDLTNPVAILDAEGEPAIIVPYIEYEGLLVRRPVLGGVFEVHPDGEIEDLSPEEAAERPEIRDSGRLFPEELARQRQDAYAYKQGIWNRFFIHEEQTQITDTELNQQPYLIDFEGRSKWVTVAEPYGRAFAANAIFLTDTVSGETEIWRVPEDQSLSGNRRAIETVKSVSIPGIVFSDEEIQTEGGGRFDVVEPRPVFIDGRLVFLVSIIPETANSVTKSVIVDAARNKVIAIFNHDTDPNADQDLLTYLETGDLPGSASPTPVAPTDPAAPSPQPAAPAPKGDAQLQQRLERLIERQRKLLEDTESLLESIAGG
ncbi:MAG: hypothetical protein ACXWZ3_01170 [Solirubrobacterales bacterium]